MYKELMDKFKLIQKMKHNDGCLIERDFISNHHYCHLDIGRKTGKSTDCYRFISEWILDGNDVILISNNRLLKEKEHLYVYTGVKGSSFWDRPNDRLRGIWLKNPLVVIDDVGTQINKNKLLQSNFINSILPLCEQNTLSIMVLGEL